MIKYFFYGFAFIFFSCQSLSNSDKNYTSDDLLTKKVKDNVYEHVSYLVTQDFGKVPCNGMVIFNKTEAIVFDTPDNDSIAAVLIDWINDSLNCKVIAVIPTHFHDDCLGGLKAFHKRQIPSYAANRTIALARAKNVEIPQRGFDDKLELKVGDKEVVVEFNGEGHTSDNVIAYFPSQKVMFGGCLVKEVAASKGNLDDANVNDWSETVMKVKEKYPDVEVVIPGHGKRGGTELLDYTIELFKQ